jgi:hypothetical protein
MISCRQSRTSAPRRTRWIRTAEVWYAHGKIGGALKAPSCLSARSRGTGEPLPRGSCNRGGSSRRQWTTRGSSPARAHRPRPPNHHSASDSLSARSARFTPWAQLTPRPRLHLRHHSRQGEGILPARGQTLRTHADYSYKFDHIVQKYQKPTADAALTPRRGTTRSFRYFPFFRRLFFPKVACARRPVRETRPKASWPKKRPDRARIGAAAGRKHVYFSH